MGLYCIGNFDLLVEKSNLWENIVETLEDNQAIGPSILLFCQNHPNTSRAVTNENDFDLVPEGGCTQQCVFRLLCGHKCTLKCHPYDTKHEKIKCPKPCTKQCTEGHLCPMKCYKKCPPCDFNVFKRIEVCGHTIEVPCHLKDTTACTEPCEKLLPCGHECRRKCGEACSKKCFVKVQIKSSICAHEINIECSSSKDLKVMMIKCQETCGTELPCGHTCQSKCGNCYQGRLHVICMEPCNRNLICGHACKSLCYRSCPPCKEICENHCVHKKCQRKCGDPCEKCTEPCEWSCPHKKCTRLCGEQCNRPLCDERCQKILKCKHPCIGVCGEPCPIECRICDKEKVEEGCFGSQVKDDALFVCLEDCRHIFEVNGLQQWVTKNSPGRNEFRLETCPTCNTVIRNTFHFGKNAESSFKIIEKIKSAVSGNENYNKLKEVLLQRFQIGGVYYYLNRLETFSAGRQHLKKALESKQKRDIKELFTMLNIANIMKIWPSHGSDVNRPYVSKPVLDENSKIMIKELREYVELNEIWLDSFITKRFSIASEQQLKDLMWEVHRLKLVDKLYSFMKTFPSDDQAHIHVNKLMQISLTYSPFREAELVEFISELQDLSKNVPRWSINVPELEIQPVLTIMSLSGGHWFLCEKGHAYSVVKCRNTSEENRCYDCDMKPKSRQHQPPVWPPHHRGCRPRARR